MKLTKKLMASAIIATLVLSPVAAFADSNTATATTSTTGTTGSATTSTETTGTATTDTTTSTNKPGDAEIQPGMTPDSFFYFFKQLARDVNLMFTFDDQKEAEL